MADANKDDQIKILVIINQSKTDIILYIYVGWAPLCRLSTISKIINPNQRHVYHKETPFKFKIFAKFLDDEERLLGPEKWKEDKVITITESLECQQENLTKIVNGRRLYLRKIHREEELAPGDLYDILGLDMKEVRKMDNEDLEKAQLREKAIQKAYEKQSLIWHPDKNFGDGEVREEIKLAKEILVDYKKRVPYHNQVDYDKGWFFGRWKAVFRPECGTEGQRKVDWHKIGMGFLSVVFVMGGVALSLGTAGAATPWVVILGAIFGGGLTGAGFQSLGHTISKKSVVDGCDWKSWGLKAGIGFVGGAITGGAAVGITAGIVGIGSAALLSGNVTAGQYVGMGAATGAVGGVVSSLFSDLGKKYIDKKKITWKQIAVRAGCGGVIGAGAGALGGLVTKGIVDSRASAATPTLKGDAVEQVSALTGGKRIGHAVAHVVSKQMTIAGTKTVLGIPSKFVDERLDDSVENQKLTKHALKGIKDIPGNVVQTAALHAACGYIGHRIEETTLDEQSSSRNAASSNEAKAENYLSTNEAEGNIQEPGNETSEGQGAGEKNNEQGNEANEEQEDDESEEKMLLKPLSFTGIKRMNKLNETGNQSNNANMNKSESGRLYTTSERGAPEPEDQSCEEHCDSTRQNPHVVSEESKANQSSNSRSCEENREPSDEINREQRYDEGRIKYNSKGARISKMIVTYYLNGKKIEKEVSGDGEGVHISAGATKIKVRFQVRRPFWGDLMKYDRFRKTWREPSRPHIFLYETAVNRTFTLSGLLWWAAVMRVSDENDKETYEMS